LVATFENTTLAHGTEPIAITAEADVGGVTARNGEQWLTEFRLHDLIIDLNLGHD
jgi:hypothetical protein